MMPDSKSFNDAEWTTWMTSCLVWGERAEDIICFTLSNTGLPQKIAEQLISDILRHPIFIGAGSVGRRAKNLENIFETRRQLYRESPLATRVELCPNLNAKDFYETFYVMNRPVMIPGFAADWFATKNWSPDYFEARFGDDDVVAQQDRNKSSDHRAFLKSNSPIKIKMKVICQQMRSAEESGLYLTSGSNILGTAPFSTLQEDFSPDEEYFDPAAREGKEFAWLGPAGVVSPLHRDPVNVMLVQIYGKKRVKLISSEDYSLIYNFESYFSQVDAEQPDLDQFPEFKKARVAELDLEPGDALFIPVLWWHHARSVTASISIGLTNFHLQNDFTNILGT